MEIERHDDGTLPAYTGLGGYPLYYLMGDGGTICPKCANGENRSIAYTGESPDGIDDAQWHIIGQDANWEDENMHCDHCNAKIESAYGE